MKTKRLTGERLALFFAKMEQDTLGKEDMGAYNIRGYVVTVKPRTKKYTTK